MKTLSHIILATLFGAGTAVANERVNFDQRDTDGDGKLSQNEWAKIGDINVSFEQIDQNNDQQLDKQEIRDSKLSLEQSGSAQRVSSQSDTQANEESEKTFNQADSDRDQRVSENEAQDAGLDYVVVHYDTIDLDADGYLDDDEWANVNYGDEVFALYDLNGDGLLTASEVAEDSYLESSFNEWDTDDDGYVTEDEADIGWFDDNDDGILDQDDW